MALGAGKVGSGSLLGRGDRQGTLLEIFGHEDPVVHTHQGPGMMGFFPLGVNLRMAFLASGGIIPVDQFLQGTNSSSLPFPEQIERREEKDQSGRRNQINEPSFFRHDPDFHFIIR
jgi:hypothetical protein